MPPRAKAGSSLLASSGTVENPQTEHPRPSPRLGCFVVLGWGWQATDEWIGSDMGTEQNQEYAGKGARTKAKGGAKAKRKRGEGVPQTEWNEWFGATATLVTPPRKHEDTGWDIVTVMVKGEDENRKCRDCGGVEWRRREFLTPGSTRYQCDGCGLDWTP